MCGRYALIEKPESVAETFGLAALEGFPPRYNIAPSQPILVVASGDAPPRGGNETGRRALLVRWGFVPGWVKDPSTFPMLINARAETAAEKPSFRAAMRHRRVLVPASGFYEWRRPQGKGAKGEPFWLRPRRGGVIAFAGLMENWSSPEGSEFDSAAIVTTAANAALKPIHDRMPVVIAPEDFSRWLDCRGQEPRDVADLMRAAPDDFFEAIPVSEKVNRVANSSPDLQEPVSRAAPEKPKPDGGGQMSFL
ncbi:SOS response-associated peptidase [Rhizobiaceae bacterium BDR2-2]|uniref:Abasic site processing protein n=1 Tax=Ectorhizobium quercum TaxID=2965071 RepID=A0AAE3N2P3_9HYPH|nr:SOS response-associated peptidase [Ectorhizobium quercum]MCX8999066.1 SOS response-associated peptidase [Ectorhizobium quercum]